MFGSGLLIIGDKKIWIERKYSTEEIVEAIKKATELLNKLEEFRKKKEQYRVTYLP